MAQKEDFRVAVAVPIRHRDLADAGQARKFFRLGERTVRLLQINRELAALRLGHEQIRQPVAVDIGPQLAALRRVRLLQRQNLELPAPERAGQHFRRLAGELGDFRAPGILRDGHDIQV